MMKLASDADFLVYLPRYFFYHWLCFLLSSRYR